VRRAAVEGGVSNTTWSNFEAGGELTYRMREAVQRAFGWPGTWPEQPVENLRPSVADDLRRLIAEQALQLEALTARVEDLDAELRLLRLAVGRAAHGSS
jgi:hypothetical protein